MANVMIELDKVNYIFYNLSGSQLQLFKGLDASQLQTYITQLQAIKAASHGLYAPTPVNEYAAAIQGLEAKQAALLLSTQGLTNAQIAETLAVNESNTAKNYQAMADAGLLARKQKLTLAQVQENLQTVLGAEADTSAAMKALGLSAATETQMHQTVKLSAAKLQEAVNTNILTEAQAQELAMRTGVILSLKVQAASTLPKLIATIQAATKAVGGQIKATAKWLATTPAGWATAAVAAIGAVTLGLNEYAKTAKKASDKAQEAYEKSKEKVQSNKEEAKSLEELIKKYEKLKSSSDVNSDTRDEIKELQYDIVGLVGAEAKNLDLVNGRLDEQLDKLKDISQEKAKQNTEDAKDSYYKAAHSSDVIVGDADEYGNDVSVKWNGIEAKQIHKTEAFSKVDYDSFIDFIKKNGFGDIFRENNDKNIFNLKFVVDTKDIQELEGKVKRLEEFKDFLASNDLQSTELYQGVVSSIERYKAQSGYELEAANNLVDAVIDSLSVSEQKLSQITVDSMDTFEQYRQTMISEAKKDGSIGEAIADGVLSSEDIEKAVNDFMAVTSEFSEWYVKWQESILGTASSFSTFDISTYKDKIDEAQSSISTLRSALESLNKGELTKISVIDLMQEFPSLAPYVDLTAEGFGNLSEGLSTLISQEPEKLIQEFNTLKEALSTDEERRQVDLLIDSLQRLSSYGDTGIEAYAGTIGNTWNDTADVIEGVTTQFENLTKVQETVAHGLTMTATQAAELAKMYPEILTKAQVTANGQITLNRDVVDSILQGDKSIINGQITKLEADKAELTAKKEYAEAQLNIIKQVGEGEGKITQETAQYVIDTANKKLKTLIEAGNEKYFQQGHIPSLALLFNGPFMETFFFPMC